VVLPTGTTLRYGLDAASRIHADGLVASWHLSEVQSPFGPRISYSYTPDPDGSVNGSDLGVLYPSHVSWAGGQRSIDFVYEARPDPIRDFRSGIERRLTSRLREVEVRSNGSVYQRRVIGYADSGAHSTHRSRVSWVQVFGTDCSAPDPVSACQGLPRQEFDYSDVPIGGGAGIQWVEMPSYQVPLGGNVHIGEPPQHMGDIDGDGLVDRLVAGQDLVGAEFVEVQLNTGAGFAMDADWTAAFAGLSSWFARLDVRQIEDDDPLDLWWEYGGVEAGVCEFLAAGLHAEPITEKFPTRNRPHVRFSTLGYGGPAFASHLEARGRWLLTDLDGDGRSDLVMSMRLSGVHVTLDCADGSPVPPALHPGVTVSLAYRNTGDGWVLDSDLVSGLPPFEEVHVEGAHYIERYAGTPYTEAEILALPGEPTNACWARGLAGLWSDHSLVPESDLCYNQINLDPRFVDFNGDGYVDLMVLERDDPLNPWAGHGDSPKLAPNPARSRAWVQRPGQTPRWVRAQQFDLPLAAPAGLPLPMSFAHSWSDHSALPATLGCTSNQQILCAPTSYNRSAGMQLVDLNRDGLVDIVWSMYQTTSPPTPIAQGVLLNMGRGDASGSAWCASDPGVGAHVGQTCAWAAKYVPPAEGDGFVWSFDPYQSAVSGFMGDLNGDGFIDYLNHSVRWAGRTRSWLHDPGAPGTWARDDRFDLPMTSQDWVDANAIWNCCENSGFAVLDVNGDGVVDVVGDTKAFVSVYAHADLVSTTRNGQGITLELVYAPARQQRLGALEDVAAAHASEPGVDEALLPTHGDVVRWSTLGTVASLRLIGPNIEPEPGSPGVTTSFRYAHPRFCTESRSDLGFRLFQRTDPAGSTRRSLFFQRHGRVGRTSRRLVYDERGSLVHQHEEDWELPGTLVPGSIDHPEVHVGRLAETRSSNRYADGSGSLPGAERVRTLAYDDGGVFGAGTEHGFNFVMEVREVRPSGEHFVKRTPAPDYVKHLVLRPGEERVEDRHGRLLAHTRLSYMDETLRSTYGDVALREVWEAPRYGAPGVGQWRATRFRYDTHGNLVERESPAPGGSRLTRFCYDGDAGCPIGHASHSLLVGVQEPSLDGGITPGAWRHLEPHPTLPRIVRVESDYSDQPTIERVFDAFGRVVAESLIPEGSESADAVLIREYDWLDIEPPQVRQYAYADESGSPTATVETIRVEDGLGGSWKQVWATPSGYAARLRWRAPASRRFRETLPVDCGNDASCLARDGSSAALARQVHADALGRSVSIETPSGFSSFHYRSESRAFPVGSSQGGSFDATLVKNGKGDLLQRLEDGERLVWLDECDSVVAPAAVLDANDACGSADTVLYTHEASGELSTVYDATGSYWDPDHYLRYHYDTRGRVIRIEDPDLTGPSATQTAYDEAGNVSLTTNARGETRSYLYDAANRLILMTPSPGDEASISVGYRPGEWQRGHELSGEYARLHVYDALGRSTRQSLRVRGYVGWWELITDFDRDLLGRIRGIVHPDSTRIRHEYAGAYLERVCELEGAATRCGDAEAVSYVDGTDYDATGRVERVELPIGDRALGYELASLRSLR
jgi:YD repeat-containing protein